MPQALQHDIVNRQQLGLYETSRPGRAVPRPVRRPANEPPLCAGCRAREARYGFRAHHTAAADDRPRALCFECFRVELAYRQAVAARLARGWNAAQARLPLEETLEALSLRRRRAQIAARKAIGA